MDIFLLLCLVALIVVLAKNWADPALTFFSFLLLCYLVGFISTEDFLSSFVNPSIIILSLLIILSDVIARTQLRRLINKALGKGRINLFKTSVMVAALSTFLSNTLVVQMFINILKDKSYKAKLLLPISYCAILGGTVTLIGTSTNLLVNGFLTDKGSPCLNFFDFAYVGIPLVIAGIAYITLIAPKILQKYGNAEEENESEYFIEAEVLKNSKLINKTIHQNKLRSLENLYLAEIIRENKLISPVSPDELLIEGDILVFTGNVANIKDLNTLDGIKIFTEKQNVLTENLVWTVLSHKSELVGEKIKDVDFRKKFNAAIVAIKRQGEKLSEKIGNVTLKIGDELILATGKDFLHNHDIKKHFYILNDLNIDEKLDLKNSIMVLGLFFTAVILSVFHILPLIKGLFVLLIFVLFKYLSYKKIQRLFNLNLVILLGSALGISKVLVNNGTSDLLSMIILNFTEHLGVYGSFIAVYFFAVILTEFTMNATAIAIAFPVAFITAQSLGVSTLPFIMAVAYGSSASFMTKFGYQTNLMVCNAGKYKTKDFLILGFPLSIIYSTIVIILVPYFFNF